MARAKLENRGAAQAVDRYVGNRLRVLCEHRGLAYVDMARHLTVSPNQVNRYLTGETTMSPWVMMKACELLAASPAALFEGLSSAGVDAALPDEEMPRLNKWAARAMVAFPRLGLDQQRTLAQFLEALTEDGAPAADNGGGEDDGDA